METIDEAMQREPALAHIIEAFRAEVGKLRERKRIAEVAGHAFEVAAIDEQIALLVRIDRAAQERMRLADVAAWPEALSAVSHMTRDGVVCVPAAIRAAAGIMGGGRVSFEYNGESRRIEMIAP